MKEPEDEAFEELAKRQGDWGLQGSRKHQIMRYLENDAMREVQRLGQEIEQCQCPECQIKPHASDCAVHSEPAYPKGKCDCGAQLEEKPVAKYMGETYLYLYKDIPVGTLLYTSQPQRKPLTDEEIWDAYMKAPVDIDCRVSDLHKFARAIEAAHGIKGNT